MPGGREGLCGDFGEESGSGPDADSGHARQDRLKRVSVDDLLDLGGDLVPLPAQPCELLRETWQNEGCGGGAGDNDGLLAESQGDLCGLDAALAGRVLQQPVPEPLLARGLHRRR